MDKEKRKILARIRDYLLDNPTDKIRLNEICNALDCQLNDISKWATTPNELIKKVLELKRIELSEIIDLQTDSNESAIDSMVVVGQEIYEQFDHLSPAKYIFIRDIAPDLYQSCQQQKLDVIRQHLELNLDKGISCGEYRSDIDKQQILEKYMKRIANIHSEDHLKSEHFTFSNIFSNIFEDYLEEVATKENWNYFRKRKQFYEAISFVKR